jgi:hypothetical protein
LEEESFMSKAGFRFVCGGERPMQSDSLWKNMQIGLRRDGLLFALAAVFLFHSLQGVAQQLAPVYVMNITAGTGGTSYQEAPYTGDGGLAPQAVISTPSDVVEDKYGNVFFLDDYNCVARVIYNSGTQVANLIALLNANNPNLTQPVVPLAGHIYTIAGVGNENNSGSTARNCGNQGDGSLATSAELNEPLGIEFDNAGNLLISDYLNQAIRKMNMTTGILTTIYGLLGTSGYAGDGQPTGSSVVFSNPSNVWVDQYGNIFVADEANQRIREINYQTGVISTVAGGYIIPPASATVAGVTNENNGSLATNAQLDAPYGVTVDAAGNMLIGNYTGGAILGVNTSGVIYDVAGVIGTLGSALGSGNVANKSEVDDARFAQDDFNGNIIVADEVNRVMRIINPQGIFPNICGAVGLTTGGCPTAATGGSIGGVFTKVGSLMTTGVIATSTTAELYDQYTGKLDWAGNIWMPNTHEGYINEMTYNTQQPATAVGATSVAQNMFLQTSTTVTPMKAVMGPSSPAEFSLGTLALSTGTFTLGTSSLPASTPLTTPITFTPTYPGLRAGQLTVTDSNNNVSIIGLTGMGTAPQASFSHSAISTFTGNGTAGGAAGQVSSPRGGVTDAAGNIYFADSGNNEIKKVTTAGVVTVLAGTGTPGYSGDNGLATAAQLNGPAKVVLDYSGDLFIADTKNNVIREVNAVTGVISTIAGNGTAGYSGDKGIVTASNVEFNAPQGIAVDPGGRVYVADTGNNAIRYFGTGGYGLIATIVGNGTAGYLGDGGPAGNAELNGPTAITVDAFGDMYIADTGNNVVRVVTSSTNNMVTFGNITTLAGQKGQSTNSGDGNVATAASLATPSDVAVDAAGDVYIAAGGAVRVVAPSTTAGVSGVISTVAGTGTAGTYGGDGGVATATVIPSASNIAINGAVGLYIFDTAGNRILQTPLGTATTLNLGTASQGASSAAQIVVLTNTGNSPLTLSGIKAVATSGTTATTTDFQINSGTSACTATTTLAAGQTCSINVTFTPASTDANGTVSGTLTVTDNSLNGTSVNQMIPLVAVVKTLAPTTITLTANPATPLYGTTYTVTATVAGGSTPTGTVNFTVNGVPVQSLALPANDTASITLTASTAGTQVVGASYSGDTNNSSSSATKSIAVQPVTLTVTAANASMTAGSTPPSFTYTFSGFVNGDTSTVVTGTPAETSTVTPDTPAGTYPITITQGSLAASNYSFNFVAGVLTVNPPLLPASGPLVFNPVPVISVIAGTGTNADSNNNGLATSAALEAVHSVAIDKAGNIFLAEYGDSVIREINASTGNITIVAGLPGQTGFLGDGGLAVNALLYNPGGVSVDNNGNLLIADTGNQVIRFVNMTTGIISTIAGTGTTAATACTVTVTTNCSGTGGTTGTTGTGGGTYGYAGDGGPATSALLDNPMHAASDAAGNVYIADYTNDAIRRVDAKTGMITTFAGEGAPGYQGDGGPATAAYLYEPADVEFDPAGNMIIAEYGNGIVRKINMATKIISTLAGQGGNNIAYNVPGLPPVSTNPVPTCSAASDNIGDNCPAAVALFNHPRGAVSDGKGNIYVADEANYLVRMVNASTGIVSIIGGNGTEGESGDGSIGFDAEVSDVYGLALDPQGNLLVADPNNYVIRKLTLDKAFPATKTASTSSFQDIYLTSTQAVTPAIAQLNNTEFKLNTLSCGLNVQLAANIPCSAAIAFKPVQAGIQTAQFAVADAKNNAIAIGIYGIGDAPVTGFYSQGTISTIAGNGTAGNKGSNGSAASAALVSAPRGGVIDSRGNIYFADSANNIVRKISPTGGIVTVAGNGTSGYTGDGAAATAAELNAPSKVIFDPAGNLYIADTGNNVIRYVNVVTGAISTAAGNGTAGYLGDNGPATAAELSKPQGLAIDLAGNVYVADTGNSVIRYFGLGGGINTVTGTGTAGYVGDGGNAYGAQLSAPQAVALDLLGDVYIADTGNDVVRVITAPSNTITTFAGQHGTAVNAGDGGTALAASLNAPTDIAFDPGNELYIAAGGQVRQINSAGIIGTIAGTGGTGPYSGEGGVAANAVIPSPATNLIVDNSGDVYMADTAGNRLLEVAVEAPATLNMGTQTPGSNSAAQVITLENTGNAAMTLSGISVSAGFSLQTTASSACSTSYPVAAGASCTISIIFNPASTATGTVTGTLTITDNALNAAAATQAVALVGTAKTVLSTTTTLKAAASTLVYGTSTTVTATVAGTGSPTGTINFAVNGTAIGSATLVSGQASITIPKSLTAGPSTVTATYSGDNNNDSSAGTTNITITPASLTVTAANASFVQGATALPVLSYTITGFLNGDTAATAVGGSALETTTATLKSAVGTYPIVVSNPNKTLTAANYTFTFVNGTLTVSPVPPANFVFTATPQNVFVVQGSTAAVTLNLTPEYGYQGTIALSCGTMPKNAVCTFTETSATTDSLGDAVSTQLTISTNNQAAIAGAPLASIAKQSPFWMAFGIPLFGLGLMLRGKDRRKWLGNMLCLSMLGVLALSVTSCAEPIGRDITPVGTYQFTITAADSKANISHTATINLTVQAPAVE